MARCSCAGDTATTVVITEDSSCVAMSGNGSIASPLSALPLLNPDPTNLLQCGTDGLYASNRSIWTPQDFGYEGAGDAAPAIQAALDMVLAAGGGTVYLPPGTYLVATLPLRIYRRTRLTLAQGATIRRAGAGTMLLNGDAGQIFPAYSGHGDIIVEGGLWDANAVNFPTSAMCMSFGHATNLLIRDLTIKDVAGFHGIELNAIKSAVVSNVHGLGYLDPGGRDFSEFLQPDLAKGSAYFGGFGPYDDTPVLDLLVTGCTVGPSGTPGTIPWPRGIGSHSASPDKPHRDIRIRDCRFQQCSQWAVGAYTWEAAVISGIQARDCGAGVWVRTLDSSNASHRTPAGGGAPTIVGSQPLSGIVIDDVTMVGGGGYGAAVHLEGEDTGFLRDVAVGRVIVEDSAGTGLRMLSVEDYRIESAITRTTAGTGISTLGTRRGRFTDCHVNGSAQAGIVIDSRSTAADAATDVTVADCSVMGAGANGIHVFDGTDVTVDSCDIYDITGYGVRVSTGTDRFTIRDTNVRATSLTPIGLTSTVTNVRRYGNNVDAPGAIALAAAASTTAETVVASWIIPAEDALPGTAYRFDAHGQASTTGTPTLTIRVRLGGVAGAVVAAFSAVTTSSAIANRGWHVSGVLHAVAPSATGTWTGRASLVHHLNNVVGQALQDLTDGTIVRDSTVDQALVVTAQWSAASASNTTTGLAANMRRN